MQENLYDNSSFLNLSQIKNRFLTYVFFLALLLFFVPVLYGKEPFIIEGKLTGQLGNQMFVVAAATSLALDSNSIATFPDLLTDTSNNIPFNYKHVFYHLNTRKGYVHYEYYEPFYHYRPIPVKGPMRLHGYFQSEKYFKSHKQEILNLFAPHPEIIDYLQTKYGNLLAHPSTVSLHLRFYKDHDPEQKIFIQYGREYCEKAMSLFSENTLFLVFSNDMVSCQKELASINRLMVYIEGELHHHDLYLMSMCKHNIICNSSFSWWAAYLNPTPGKIVIAPPHWYAKNSGLDDKDILPEEWLRLDL